MVRAVNSGDRTTIGSVQVTPAGSPVITTTAWIALRTRGVHPALTEDLHRWAHHGRRHRARDRDDARAWPGLALAWCHARGHVVAASGIIVHTRTRLDTPLWVLPAATVDARRIAVIGLHWDQPTVYADGCAEPWPWRDADTIVITCPTGHAWTWHTGRELSTATGRATTIAAVFGPSLDAPFTACPTCRHRDDGRAGCSCDRSPWIVCPTCRHTCTLTLPTP